MKSSSLRRRGLAVVGVAAAAALALAGCSSSGSDSGSGKHVTLTVWYNSADTDAEKAVYAAYEKKSGNTIKLVSIPAAGFEDATMTRWATGSRPDILEFHPVAGFLAGLNPEQNLQPLDGMPYIKQSGDYYQSVGTWNGHVYAAVMNTPGMFGMYYNKAALANAGVEAPKTYDDLVKVCQAIKAKTPGVAPIYQAGADQWPLTALPFNLWGGSFDYAEKIAYNKATFNQKDSPFPVALQKFKDLQDMGCFNSDATTGTVTAGFAAITGGQAAIVFQSSDQLSSLQAAAGSPEKADETIGWGSVGTTKPYANYSPGPNGTYMAPITKDSDREKAAKDFIAFATGSYYQTYVDQAKINPLIKAPGITAPTGLSKLQQSINDFYDQSPKQPLFNSDIAGFGNFVQLMPQLLAGQLTPETLADKLQAIVQQASVAANVKGWS
jgi:raffinose/stachyose/melibiose transport system substrate-binding protein